MTTAKYLADIDEEDADYQDIGIKKCRDFLSSNRLAPETNDQYSLMRVDQLFQSFHVAA